MKQLIKDLRVLVGMLDLAVQDKNRDAQLRYITQIGNHLNKIVQEVTK